MKCSAQNMGNGLTWLPISVLGFHFFFDLLDKIQGEKHVVGIPKEHLKYLSKENKFEL